MYWTKINESDSVMSLNKWLRKDKVLTNCNIMFLFQNVMLICQTLLETFYPLLKIMQDMQPEASDEYKYSLSSFFSLKRREMERGCALQWNGTSRHTFKMRVDYANPKIDRCIDRKINRQMIDDKLICR